MTPQLGFTITNNSQTSEVGRGAATRLTFPQEVVIPGFNLRPCVVCQYPILGISPLIFSIHT